MQRDVRATGGAGAQAMPGLPRRASFVHGGAASIRRDEASTTQAPARRVIDRQRRPVHGDPGVPGASQITFIDPGSAVGAARLPCAGSSPYCRGRPFQAQIDDRGARRKESSLTAKKPSARAPTSPPPVWTAAQIEEDRRDENDAISALVVNRKTLR